MQHILIGLVRLYRCTLSPAKTFLFGPLSQCRFTPSCSQYALDALRQRGALAGTWLAARRICRCNPWGGCGHDPVPEVPGVRCQVSGVRSRITHHAPRTASDASPSLKPAATR